MECVVLSRTENTGKIHPGAENREFPTLAPAAKRTTAPATGSRDVARDSLVLDANVCVVSFVGALATPSGRKQDVAEAPPPSERQHQVTV